jgi:Fe2+ or Zn2+ uptake regulation protein
MFAQSKKSFIEKRIKELGFRMTAQRRIILDAIGRAGEHATVDEIIFQVQAVDPQISHTTVYRTLETFSRYRLIHGNEIAGGHVYELVAENAHHHLLCHKCWTDIPIEEEKFQEFQKKIENEYGFLILSEHNLFMGLCSECRQKYGDTLGRFSPYPKFDQYVLKEEQNL